MPRSSATTHELTRVGLLAGLPGETLGRLARAMEREELAPGAVVGGDGRVYVVFAGMLSASGRVLRPGDHFESPARTMTPCVVASCERAVFEDHAGPLD